MRLKSLFLALALVATTPACSSDDKKTETDNETTTQSVSKEITAEDGGEVTLGDAALNIPGGSLAGDTTITIESSAPSSDLPGLDALRGKVYDFGPDGTEFSEPAQLTLPSIGNIAADEVAVVAWLDESTDTWQDLATTVNDDGSLSAEITHFTTFVVRLNGVVTNDCSFSACGGDIVGTWTVTGACASAANTFEDTCPTAVAGIDIALSGSATFDADGTYTTDFTSQVSFTYTLPASCLVTLSGGVAPTSCDELSDPADPESENGPTDCTGDPTVSCTCVQANPEKSQVKTGTYTTAGSTLTTIDDVEGTPNTAEYCVNGSEGRFAQDEGLATLTWIATKH